MADDSIIVKARIVDVVSCVPVHKIARDPEGEKRVKEELKASMKAEGLDPKDDSKDFRSRYRAKLRAYAVYKDGSVDETPASADGPALMVPRRVFEYELKVTYTANGREYTNTVNYDSDKKELKKDDSFYLTVNKKNPMAVSKKSDKDYRPEEKVEQGNGPGCFVLLLILGFIAFVYLMETGGAG